MNFTEKIEVIRQKPEHIRLRYVWFLVVFCMTFIFIIWIFSLKIQPVSAPVMKDNIISSDLIEQFQSQKKSWQETQQQLEDRSNEVQNQIEQPFAPPR